MMRARPTLKTYFQAYKNRFGKRPVALTPRDMGGVSGEIVGDSLCPTADSLLDLLVLGAERNRGVVRRAHRLKQNHLVLVRRPFPQPARGAVVCELRAYVVVSRQSVAVDIRPDAHTRNPLESTNSASKRLVVCELTFLSPTLAD